ncbi:hypothetical protein CEE37_14015 [candidate division LCP-89 bacterium B3_LCP]|uniref:Secretion system C-terminal sorting domain-containing protein n=1 Tax=candidate division LCP-89 bacterium B3_LCP TaxID=2012998 RepID=A0A532URW2_UNCL8|nr:MAG: hypothetical protein CEE37_14015 [candidate division LCP-89 bacterium B3_LCP]
MKKKMVIIPVLFLYILLGTNMPASGQVIEEWAAIYNGTANGEDAAQDIAVDAEGNVYVTGYEAASAVPPYNFNYMTIKYDSTGAIVWMAGYNGMANEDDIPQAIALDNNNNVYVTGWTDIIPGPGANMDYATVKYDPNGIFMWAVTYNGPGNQADVANDVVADDMGNCYVTGLSWGMQSGEDYATIKYDPMGLQLWVARYNGPSFGSDEAQALVVDMAGNTCVTGWSQNMFFDFDYTTVLYDPMGVQLWVHRYNGPAASGDLATDIALDPSGNFCVTGISYGGAALSNDIATLVINPAGATVWVNRYDWVGEDDGGEAVAVDPAGNVYVTGYSANFPGLFPDFDYATIMYSATGAQLWVSRYDGPISEDDKAKDIEVDVYGNAFVTGWCTAADTTKDYCTIKYDASGAQQWVMFYNGPNGGDDLAQALALSPEGHCFVTGWINGYTGIPYDWATVKYTPTVMVWLFPHNAPIQIPASGGSFDYKIGVRNFNTASTTFDVWCDATKPNGAHTGTLLGPVNLTVVAGFGAERDKPRNVPAVAPSGIYSYNAYVGVYPGTIWDADHLTFEKLTDGDNYSGEENWIVDSEWFLPTNNEEPVADVFQLIGNYPNPFNPTTTISFSIPVASLVKLDVFDISGSRVGVGLAPTRYSPGTHQITFDGSNLPSGIYLYLLTAGECNTSGKMVLMK